MENIQTPNRQNPPQQHISNKEDLRLDPRRYNLRRDPQEEQVAYVKGKKRILMIYLLNNYLFLNR